MRIPPLTAVSAAVLLFLVAGCASPEASRVRGGDSGAYFADRDEPEVQLDGEIDIYHEVPCAMVVACDEPTPDSTRRRPAPGPSN